MFKESGKINIPLSIIFMILTVESAVFSILKQFLVP